MCQLFSRRSLHFIPMPEIIAYAMAHTVEALCALSVALEGSPTPRWLGDSVYLQPATFGALASLNDAHASRAVRGRRHRRLALPQARGLPEPLDDAAGAPRSDRLLSRRVPMKAALDAK